MVGAGKSGPGLFARFEPCGTAYAPLYPNRNDSLITKELWFCIYKYWLMGKDFQARIYKWEDW